MAEHKLDAETREKLIGLMPFSQNGTIDFIPKPYTAEGIPKKYRATFTQRSFTRDECDYISALMGEDKSNNEQIMESARRTVVGFKNVYDLSSNKEVVFEAAEDKGCKQDIFAMIPQPIIAHIYFNALKLSGLASIESLGLKYSPESTPEQ